MKLNKEPLHKLVVIRDFEKATGKHETSEYSRGFVNGLIYAVSLFDGKPAEFMRSDKDRSKPAE